MRAARLVIAAVIVGAAVMLALHVSSGTAGRLGPVEEPIEPRPSNPNPMTLSRSEECRACHQEVYEEWRRSHHAFAYVNPEVQKNSRGFQDAECLPCHVPRPVFETGLGIRVLERGTNLEDGVDCFTCHFDPGNNVMLGAGPLGPEAAEAPCQPAVHPDIRSMQLCWPCHNQHKVHDEWAQTLFAQPGEQYKDCNDCHMEAVERAARSNGSGRMGRSHVFPGAHDPAMLKKAASVTVDGHSGDGILRVKIENTGAGHNFPTDERHRAVDFELVAHARDGRLTQVRVARYRNPYRDEFELHKNPLREPGSTHRYSVSLGEFGEVEVEAVRVAAAFNPNRTAAWDYSTQIPHGEARSYVLRLPPSIVSTTVLLYYRKSPWLPDDEAVKLYETTVELH